MWGGSELYHSFAQLPSQLLVTLMIQFHISGFGELLKFKKLEHYYPPNLLELQRKTIGALPRKKEGDLEKEGQHLAILTESNPRRKFEPVASSAFLKAKVQSCAINTY